MWGPCLLSWTPCSPREIGPFSSWITISCNCPKETHVRLGPLTFHSCGKNLMRPHPSSGIRRRLTVAERVIFNSEVDHEVATLMEGNPGCLMFFILIWGCCCSEHGGKQSITSSSSFKWGNMMHNRSDLASIHLCICVLMILFVAIPHSLFQSPNADNS